MGFHSLGPSFCHTSSPQCSAAGADADAITVAMRRESACKCAQYCSIMFMCYAHMYVLSIACIHTYLCTYVRTHILPLASLTQLLRFWRGNFTRSMIETGDQGKGRGVEGSGGERRGGEERRGEGCLLCVNCSCLCLAFTSTLCTGMMSLLTGACAMDKTSILR